MKYTDAVIVLAEVPDNITLAINISNCPNHCPGCHSAYLSEDIGNELNKDSLKSLIDSKPDITCVSFMGGDSDPGLVIELGKWVKIHYPSLNTAWYTGRDHIEFSTDAWYSFDYIKVGSYIEELGPLNSLTTNQRMYYKNESGNIVDITYRFHK